MKALAFESTGEVHGGKRIRRASLCDRSVFPVSAACLVANAVRDVLSRTLDERVDVRLFEPCIPDASAWAAIAAGASVFRVSGMTTDAALVVRMRDAAALAGAAFGEYDGADRTLSPMEARVLERIVQNVASALVPACGAVVSVRRDDARLEHFATFFEVQIEGSFAARIGIALAREPDASPVGSLPFEALDDVPVELCVRTPGAYISVEALACLQVGDLVPMTTGTGVISAELSVAGRTLARGECGVRGNRLALAIGLWSRSEGGSEPES